MRRRAEGQTRDVLQHAEVHQPGEGTQLGQRYSANYAVLVGAQEEDDD